MWVLVVVVPEHSGANCDFMAGAHRWREEGPRVVLLMGCRPGEFLREVTRQVFTVCHHLERGLLITRS